MRKFKLEYAEVRSLKETREVLIYRNNNLYLLKLSGSDADGYHCEYSRSLKNSRYSIPRPCGISYPAWAFMDFKPIIEAVIRKRIEREERAHG